MDNLLCTSHTNKYYFGCSTMMHCVFQISDDPDKIELDKSNCANINAFL